MIPFQLLRVNRQAAPVVVTGNSSIEKPLFGTSMTSDSNADFVVTDSQHFSTDPAWMAFDAPAVPGTRSFWYHSPYSATAWMQVECKTPKTLRSLRIYHDVGTALGASSSYAAKHVKVEGAQSASGPWTVIEAAKAVSPWTNVRASQFLYLSPSVAIANETAYSFYRFTFARTSSFVAIPCLMLSESSNIWVEPGTVHALGGSTTDGYLGEVDGSALILYSALWTAAGASNVGAAVNNDQYHWMKFRSDGKTLFVSKQNPRFQMSWNQLNGLGLIYGEKTIVISGRTYKVRSLTTAEWDKLMYPIASTRPGGVTGWGAAFTQTELGMSSTVSRQCHVQDGAAVPATNCVTRGTQTSIQPTTTYTKAQAATDMGWRAVLELVPEA